MNKPSRLPPLHLRRTSLRPLLQDDDLRRVAGGRRNTITSYVIGSACDPHCVSRETFDP
jgi:hypothetical protein